MPATGLPGKFWSDPAAFPSLFQLYQRSSLEKAKAYYQKHHK